MRRATRLTKKETQHKRRGAANNPKHAALLKMCREVSREPNLLSDMICVNGTVGAQWELRLALASTAIWGGTLRDIPVFVTQPRPSEEDRVLRMFEVLRLWPESSSRSEPSAEPLILPAAVGTQWELRWALACTDQRSAHRDTSVVAHVDRRFPPV